MHLLVFGTDRVELLEVESGEPYLRLKVRRLPRPKDETTEVDALHREVLEVANQISELLASHTPVALIDVVMQTKDMMQQLYLLASLLSMDVSKAQALLAAPTRQQALEKMHEFSRATNCRCSNCGTRSPPRPARKSAASSGSICCGNR